MSIGIVTTKYGQLRGAELTGKYDGITTFRSVPYAEPPIGERRFKAPVPHEPWPGVRDATHFACRPMQDMGMGPRFEPWASDFYYDGYTPMSEDCLYLHITTGAQSPEEKRPVFMWFHGGGLATGYYSEVEFDPSELAKKGIVVVTVGQRLNIMGYLCLPQLSEEQDGISGNYGLKDELMALDWVRENIASFGGDPDNITVGGQSGGTAKSTALTTCPFSQGKIRRCINQSNLAWLRGYETMESAYENGRAYLESCGIDPDASVEELRRIPADRFYIGNKDRAKKGSMPASMVADGKFVVHLEASDNMAEFGCSVDYLSGGNLGESNIRGNSLFQTKPYETAEEFYAVMKEKLGDLYDKYDFESLWPVTDENANYCARILASRAFANSWGGPSTGGVIMNRYFGAWLKSVAPSVNTYAYTFSHVVPSLPEEKGTFRDQDNLLAWHSSELWFTFSSLRENVPPIRPWRASDFELADVISSYWANFIATGDPNNKTWSDAASAQPELPFWPKSDENYGWMDLGDVPQGHEGLDKLDELALEYLRSLKVFPEIQ